MRRVSSADNPAVKAARKLARRGRPDADGQFLVEGPQAVAEALPFLRRLFVTDAAAGRRRGLVAAARRAGVEVLVVPDGVLAGLATTVTDQGVVGVARLPAVTLDAVLQRAGLLLVLVEVRDPGNAGTVTRSADAAGADAVIFTRGSVDPCNAKAVRASAGSLFHLPVARDVAVTDVLTSARDRGVRLVGAAADGATPYTDADLTGPTALLFGNEAHGLPGDVRAACHELVHVPLHRAPRPGYAGGAESLNLAAAVAVVLYEAARQRRASSPPPGAR